MNKIFMRNKKEKNQRFFQYNFFPKNRRADVPITILVIGVIALCILAISSFVVANSREDYIGIELIEKIHSDMEKFYFYLNSGFSREEAIQNLDDKIIKDQFVQSLYDEIIMIGNQLVMERVMIVGTKKQVIISVKYIKELE